MKKTVITIARSFGSGGRTIGKMLSDRLDIPYYDQDLIKLASEESGIFEGLFGEADEKLRVGLLNKLSRRYKNEIVSPDSDDFVSDDNLFNFQANVIRRLADTESCVIVGRCADYLLGSREDVVRVFVHASQEACIRNVRDFYSISEKEAAKLIEKTDRSRSAYYRYYTGRDWNLAENYDLCLDTSRLDFQKCVEIIVSYIGIR